MKCTHKTILISSLFTALAACGGGGGGNTENGSNGAPQTSPTSSNTGVTLTPTNVKSIANAVVSNFPFDDQNKTSGAQLTGVVAETGNLFNIVNYTRNKAIDLLKPMPLSAQVTGIASTATTSCITGDASSGTLTVEYTDADSDNKMSSGDSVVYTYTNCSVDAASTGRLTGAIKYQLTQSSTSTAGGKTVTIIKYDILYQQLQVTGDRPTTYNGPSKLVYTQEKSSSVDQSITAMTMNGLSISLPGEARYYNSYRYVQTVNNNTHDYTISGDGNISMGYIVGPSFTFTTPEPLTGTGDAAPTHGTLKIKGTNGTLIVSPTNQNQVKLSIDIGDNGTIDSEQVMSWSDL